MIETASETGGAVGPAARGGLTRRDFFDEVLERVRDRLPPEWQAFRAARQMSLLKLDYGNQRVHYEVWPNSQTGWLEIGLHFEDGPVSTAAYLAFFDARIVELKHRLGPQIELERWTPSWGHLYEVLPLGRLDRRLAERAADRLAALIAEVQPLVAQAGVAPERSAQPAEPRGPWRRWRH